MSYTSSYSGMQNILQYKSCPSPLRNFNLECGASYGEGDVSILLYADDIVLLSDNEAKLQRMLCCLNDYCLSWGLTINFEK